jgi:prepilin-type N-terminal cleavage/methylation domain-containing protein
MKSISKTKRAFTLVELLVVITIIALLAALTVGLYSRVKGKTVESAILAEMEQVKLALQSYKEDPKHGVFPPSGPPGNNKLYYYLSGEAELMKSFGLRPPQSFIGNFTTLVDLHNLDPGVIKERRMKDGIKNLLPNLKKKQFDKTGGSRNSPIGNLYSPLPDEAYPETGAPWIYESRTPTHNRETYDLSVKILDVQEVNGVYTTNVVKEIGNW